MKARNVRLKSSNFDTFLKGTAFDANTSQNNPMQIVHHPAASRGHADHGWLQSHHSFSFASYHNPERVHFGVLRVLNDDTVSEGRGFGSHPHDNMEIISLPLEGDLKHQDSMGNTAVIKEGDIQVMSAGTGIFHSEYNLNPDQPVKFLQIWIFPNEKDVVPRYDQLPISELAEKNAFYQILSPDPDDAGVWIYQDAWFHLGEFDTDTSGTYTLKKPGNGVYAFVIEGEATLAGHTLSRRDGLGISDTDAFDFEAKEGAKILLMEVPMKL